MPKLTFDHVNLPALKPEWLAEWYAEQFELTHRDGFVLGAGVVIVFEQGKPLLDDDRVRFGFRCETQKQVQLWADKLGVELEQESAGPSAYCGFVATDPEGYKFEVYWEQ